MSVLKKRILVESTSSHKRYKTSKHFALIDASICGDLQRVKELIEDAEIDVNQTGQYGQTALHFACKNGNIAIVNVLLSDLQIDVNAVDIKKQTSLYKACMYGHVDVVRVLLSRCNIKLNIRDNWGKTALRRACEYTPSPIDPSTFQYHKIVELLLGTKGIDVNTCCKNGLSPLECIVISLRSCYSDTLISFIQRAIILFIRNPRTNINNSYLFHYVCSTDNRKLLKMLLARNDVDINRPDRFGLPPLIQECRLVRTKTVKLLTACKRIDINAVDGYGRNALFISYIDRNIETFRYLIERTDIEINNTNIYQQMCKHNKFKEKVDREMLALLLRHKNCNPNEYYIGNVRLLVWACRMNYQNIIKAILQSPHLDTTQDYGYTSILQKNAILYNHKVYKQILINHPTYITAYQNN